MSLTPGTRLGVYEITSQIGEGGMGQVFRATDTRLKRQVAIKILPPSLAADADRLARFQREAEVLASLNHPNIAHIHGLEDGAGMTALVMELVEGEDLSQRIARGAIPLDEALPIAKQIAEALEAAHEQGIIHRDLKPANIKVRSDGTVKVLDFGLAKALEPAGAMSVSMSTSPTLTTPAMTQAGMILGTAAYMSPEQARGKTVDRRADIWAFGAVLFEMLSGRRAFDAEDVSLTLAEVMKSEPDWSLLPAIPPALGAFLRQCLKKDPRQRAQSIGDVRLALEGAFEIAVPHATTASAITPHPLWKRAIPAVAAVLVAVALAVAVWLRQAPVLTVDPPLVRFQIERSTDAYNRTVTAFAVSPDGVMLAYYGAGGDGPQTLLVRTLATGEVRQVQGSATAAPVGNSLFWSPDGRQLVRGTATGGQVFDLRAGTTHALCECRYVGGSWNRDGAILLGGSDRTTRPGISRLSANDRTLVAVTTPDGSRGEQDTSPIFLPDGRRFLFTRSVPGAGDATYVATLDGDPPKRIVDGSRSIFVPPAGGLGPYLVGIDAAGLVAQPFDLNTMGVTGPAITIIAGATAVSASKNGVLATSALGSRPRTVPTWFDRKGMSLEQVGEAGVIESIALSPDGQRLAVTEQSGGPGSPAIWLRDLASGTRTRVTFDGDSNSAPVWSPDGRTIAFTSGRNGVRLPYRRATDGTGNEVPLFAYDRTAYVNDWSSDGRWVIYSTPGPNNTGNRLWIAPTEGGTERKPQPYLVASAMQQQAQFSPDGRFVAYGSDQSGTWEIYVQPFPNASEGKWMVSSGGAVEPRWSRDGKELFYFSGQTLMTVPVSMRPTFSHGAPAALFDAPVQAGYTSDSHRWQVAPDGKRFLLLVSAGKDQAPPLDVVANWPALLKK